MLESLPDTGFVFWPVGTGDSTTITVNQDSVMQVDIHHLADAEDDDDPRTPIIDELVRLLPKRNGKPYLSTFVLTHPDQDHCRGFKSLREQVEIGELWFAPRIFREHKKDLCDDAQDFQTEAKRRVGATIDGDGDVESGDRVRIIGYSDLLEEDDFKGFPEDRLHAPGEEIAELDGEDLDGLFSAFIHAPFKDDDVASERNETSVGLRIELTSDGGIGRALLLGDLSYPTVRRVFDESKDHDNEDKLEWDVFLSPHQCSKSVMYWKDEGEDEETLRQDILDDIQDAANDSGYIIASSNPIPAKNKDGDNPPHVKAKNRYEEIAPDDFLCTGEHTDESAPEPIVFEVIESGFTYVEPDDQAEEDKDKGGKSSAAAFAASVDQAKGGAQPSTQRVGYGKG